MERVGGRRAWLPAHLLATPLMLVGAYLLMAIDVGTTRTGARESVVRMVFPSPALWFEVPGRAWTGLAMLLLGVTAWVLVHWRPSPGARLVVTRYGSFSMGAVLLAMLGAVVLVDLSAPVFEASQQGLHWRFLLGLRGHVLDQVVAYGAFAGALACYVLSFGPVRPQRRPVPTDAWAT